MSKQKRQKELLWCTYSISIYTEIDSSSSICPRVYTHKTRSKLSPSWPNILLFHRKSRINFVIVCYPTVIFNFMQILVSTRERGRKLKVTVSLLSTTTMGEWTLEVEVRFDVIIQFWLKMKNILRMYLTFTLCVCFYLEFTDRITV